MTGRLPVSQLEVEVRQPSGNDDLLLLESEALDMRLALVFAERVASVDGAKADWGALPVPDLDALLLFVRRSVFGDAVRGTVRCREPGCGTQVDVSFGIAEYVSHHRPRRPRGVQADAEPGWFSTADGSVRFRLPTVADLIAASADTRPDRALANACIRPCDAPRALRRRAERAMDALAPALAREVAGTCPECGGPITMLFDPQRYVLTELRDQAASLHEEVHVLASAYHWAEHRILALPRSRRRRYAELVLGEPRAV